LIGDNIFYGHGLQGLLTESTQQTEGATVFGYYVSNPTAYGVAEFDANGVVVGLEITDLNRIYLDAGNLRLQKLGRGVAWLDTGTPEALLQAANFVQTIQERQGLRASCPEEISFRKGWIDADQLARLAKPLEKTEYGQYLQALATGLDV
jgi:glucose-1-phosphate thymidylyltransferase